MAVGALPSAYYDVAACCVEGYKKAIMFHGGM
jgi:hypothetical protein